MRRLIALIIMFIIPLQFAWSAATGLHGHMGMGQASEALGMHTDHDYHDAGHVGPGLSVAGDPDNAHNEDGHHGSHCHHVFSFILHQPGSLPGLELRGGPVQHAPAAFLSRIPPLLDRPPLARA